MKKRSKNTTALALSMITGITAICGIMSQGIEASAQADYVVRDEKITYRGHTYAFMDAGEYRLNSYREVEDFCRSMGGHLAVITMMRMVFCLRLSKTAFPRQPFSDTQTMSRNLYGYGQTKPVLTRTGQTTESGISRIMGSNTAATKTMQSSIMNGERVFCPMTAHGMTHRSGKIQTFSFVSGNMRKSRMIHLRD